MGTVGQPKKGKTESYLLRLSPAEMAMAKELAERRGVKIAELLRGMITSSHKRTVK